MKRKTLKAKTRLIILMGIAVSLWIVLMTVYVAVMMFLLTSCAPQITRYNPEGYTDSTEYCWYTPTDTGWVHHCEFHYHEPGFKIYPEGGVYQENDSIVGSDTLKYWTR